MKTITNFLLFPAVVLSLSIISWTFSNKKTEQHGGSYETFFSNKNLRTVIELESASDQDYSDAPVAEDVLVQKITGDNEHLLIMAVYSYAKYSGQFVKISNNGAELILRDDGEGYDKVAGDGVFTARINANVTDFKKQAVAFDADMRKDKYVVQFTGRELKPIENCNTESFDLQKFDQGQVVSIASLSPDSNNLLDSIRNNCIFITNLGVVEDPIRTWNYCTQQGNIDGAWTFKTLMKNLAKQSASVDPTDAELSSFVLKWLNNWKTVKVINGDTVPARSLISQRIIIPWQTKSFNAGAPSGQLDMRFAPFKLTAIVNRFDLRERASGIPAGEARFVFCLIESNCDKTARNDLYF
jgi:hypothetical protein